MGNYKDRIINELVECIVASNKEELLQHASEIRSKVLELINSEAANENNFICIDDEDPELLFFNYVDKDGNDISINLQLAIAKHLPSIFERVLFDFKDAVEGYRVVYDASNSKNNFLKTMDFTRNQNNAHIFGLPPTDFMARHIDQFNRNNSSTTTTPIVGYTKEDSERQIISVNDAVDIFFTATTTAQSLEQYTTMVNDITNQMQLFYRTHYEKLTDDDKRKFISLIQLIKANIQSNSSLIYNNVELTKDLVTSDEFADYICALLRNGDTKLQDIVASKNKTELIKHLAKKMQNAKQLFPELDEFKKSVPSIIINMIDDSIFDEINTKMSMYSTPSDQYEDDLGSDIKDYISYAFESITNNDPAQVIDALDCLIDIINTLDYDNLPNDIQKQLMSLKNTLDNTTEAMIPGIEVKKAFLSTYTTTMNNLLDRTSQDSKKWYLEHYFDKDVINCIMINNSTYLSRTDTKQALLEIVKTYPSFFPFEINVNDLVNHDPLGQIEPWNKYSATFKVRFNGTDLDDIVNSIMKSSTTEEVNNGLTRLENATRILKATSINDTVNIELMLQKMEKHLRSFPDIDYKARFNRIRTKLNLKPISLNKTLLTTMQISDEKELEMEKMKGMPRSYPPLRMNDVDNTYNWLMQFNILLQDSRYHEFLERRTTRSTTFEFPNFAKMTNKLALVSALSAVQKLDLTAQINQRQGDTNGFLYYIIGNTVLIFTDDDVLSSIRDYQVDKNQRRGPEYSQKKCDIFKFRTKFEHTMITSHGKVIYDEAGNRKKVA